MSSHYAFPLESSDFAFCMPPLFVEWGKGIKRCQCCVFMCLSISCSGYLVCATPTVLRQSFLNFTGVLSWAEDVHVVWIYSSDFFFFFFFHFFHILNLVIFKLEACVCVCEFGFNVAFNNFSVI